MKKFLASVLALAMVLSLITVPTFAASCGGGEDDFYFEVNAENCPTGTSFHKIGCDYDDSTLDDATQWEVSVDVRSYSRPENPTQSGRGGFGFTFSGTDYGFIDVGYLPNDKAVGAAYAGLQYGFGLGFDASKYSYEWPADETVKFGIRREGSKLSILINGEVVSSHDDGRYEKLRLSNIVFETINTYVAIDNLVIKKLDTGTEMTNIDFSESDINTKYFVPTSGPIDADANGSGEVKWIEAPAPVGEDEYVWNLTAETENGAAERAGSSSNFIGYDYDFNTIGEKTSFEVSADITYLDNAGVVGNDPQDLFGFEISGTDCGFMEFAYYPSAGAFSAAYGGGAAGSNGWGVGDWPTNTAAFTWNKGEKHNFKIVKTGSTIKYYIDGEEILSVSRDGFDNIRLAKDGSNCLRFITRNSYVEVDNIIVKNVDSGAELTNIDFSEENALTELFTPDTNGTQKAGVGAVKFIPAPVTADEYAWNLTAETENGTAERAGSSSNFIGYDYDLNTIGEKTSFEVSADITYLDNAGVAGNDPQDLFGFEISGTDCGFMEFAYYPSAGAFSAAYGGGAAGSNGWGVGDWPTNTAAFTWNKGEKHNFKIVKTGSTIKYYIDGEEILSVSRDGFDNIRLAQGGSNCLRFITRNSYVEVDNIIVKNVNSGAELTNIDFSEENALTELFTPDTDGTQKAGVGAIKFTPGTSGHDWADPTCTTPRTCKKCGKTSGAPLGHKPDRSEPDCTNPVKCIRENCPNEGGIITPELGHDWKDADCTTPKTCNRCGETEGEPLGHDWKEADCLNPKTCNRCKVTEGDPLGHDFGNAQCGTVATCLRCGEEDPSGAVSHVPDRDAPTCTDPVKCTRDNCSIEDHIITPALGHDFSIPATCTENGKCSRCGTYDENQPALNHPTKVHGRCTVCGKVPGLDESNLSDNHMPDILSYKALHSTGTNADGAYVATQTLKDYRHFSWTMNLRPAAVKDANSFVSVALYDKQVMYNFAAKAFVVMKGTEQQAVIPYDLPVNGEADVELGVDKDENGNFEVYIDGEKVYTATDMPSDDTRTKITVYNVGVDLYTDYIILADTGYLDELGNDVCRHADKVTAWVTLKGKDNRFDGTSDGDTANKETAFLTSPDMKLVNMKDWKRLGYNGDNYNFIGSTYTNLTEFAFTADVVFNGTPLWWDNNQYGSQVYFWMPAIGAMVGYDFSKGVAFVRDNGGNAYAEDSEVAFNMPQDEVVQFMVKVANFQDGKRTKGRISLLVNGELVLEYVNSGFVLPSDGAEFKENILRIFNTITRVSSVNMITSNIDSIPMMTAHHGGTATCAALAVCEECGKSYGVLDAENHTWGEWVADNNADCEHVGTKTRTCSGCNATETVEDPENQPITHEWGEWVANNDANCQHVGTKTRTCAKCQLTETVEDPEGQPITDHAWGEWVANNDATCQHVGTKTHTCTVCQATETVDDPEGQPIKDHEYVNDVCKWCGEEDPNAFVWGDADSDGKVDSKDAVVIARYLAKWSNIEINLKAVDFDGDGELTSSEAVYVSRYLAKWTNLPYRIGEKGGPAKVSE